MCGQIAYDWNTMPSPRSFAGTRVRFADEKNTWPPTEISPASGVSRPATQRSVVVLPQPDGPSSVNSSPSFTVKEMSSTASTRPRFSPRLALKVLTRFVTFSISASSGDGLALLATARGRQARTQGGSIWGYIGPTEDAAWRARAPPEAHCLSPEGPLMLPLKDNVPTRTFPVVTVGLIAVNVLVYLWEVSGKGLNNHVFRWGYYPCAVDGPCVGFYARHHHELVETVFSSMFMHGGIVHIGGNMLFLWIFGNNVEDALGRVRFLVWYLLAGIAATAAQTFVTLDFGTASDASIPNVGASGAIAGVLTAIFLGFFFIFREVPALLFLGIWIGLQALDGTLSLTTPQAGGGVAFFAHIGGFAFGILTVHLVKQRPPLQPVVRYRWR